MLRRSRSRQESARQEADRFEPRCQLDKPNVDQATKQINFDQIETFNTDNAASIVV